MTKIKRGNLIIAKPTIINDDIFNRSVILLSEHNKNDTVGFILNKKVDLKISNLIPNIKVDFDVFFGGPVETNQCFVLHTKDIMLAQTTLLNENLCVTRDKAIITTLNENRFPQHYRIIIGSSSWGPGQLESELLGSRTNGASSWCSFPYTEDFMWNTEPQQQWNTGIEQSAKSKVTNYLNF